MKKTIYVLAVTLVIATLVITSTASIPIVKHATEEETTPEPLAIQTDYFSIPAAAFIPEDSSTIYSNDGTYLNGAGEFFAPVYLPSKATVTKLLFFWSDYNGPDDGTVRLKRYTFGTSAYTMAEAFTSGSTGSGASEDNSIDNAKIDNSQYSYFVVFEAPSTGIICNNVIIEYNYEPVIVPVNRIINRDRQMFNTAKNPVIFPLNGDNFIQRFRRLLSGEIIDVDISDNANINPSKINGTAWTSTDIVTSSIPYDNNPLYSENIGFIVDVSSKIPIGFTLIEVTAKGRKTHQVTGELQDEPPLILYPTVNGTNIEILIWDADKSEYGGTGWSNMKASIEYTLFIKK